MPLSGVPGRYRPKEARGQSVSWGQIALFCCLFVACLLPIWSSSRRSKIDLARQLGESAHYSRYVESCKAGFTFLRRLLFRPEHETVLPNGGYALGGLRGSLRRQSGRDLSKVSRGIVGLDGRAECCCLLTLTAFRLLRRGCAPDA